MPVGFDPGDPRGWGISPIEAEDGTGRAPRISFYEFMREARRGARREDELTMGELDAWLAREEHDRNRRRYYENEICRPDEEDAWRATRLEAIQTVARAYDLPEEIVSPRAEYDDLIESTRAEFPYDPFDYGRRCPAGPMRWTPPPEGEEVPRCPA